jgi:hypothetical protein
MTTQWGSARINLVGSKPIAGPAVLHWDALKSVPERTRKILTDYDAKLSAVEGDKTLSPLGKSEKLAALAKQANDELQKLTAEPESVTRRVGVLTKKMDEDLAKAKESTSEFIRGEIRAHLRNNSGIKAALPLRDNPAILSAVMEAPAALSGMTEAEVAILKRESLRGPEADELADIERARGIGADAVREATSMVSTRSGLANAAPKLRAVGS